MSYMRSQAGPASSDVDSEAKWAKVSANSEALVVGFFDDYTQGNGQVFMKVADALRDNFRFAHVTNADVLKASGQEAGSIVLFRPRAMKNKFEPIDIKYDGDKFTGKLNYKKVVFVRNLIPRKNQQDFLKSN